MSERAQEARGLDALYAALGARSIAGLDGVRAIAVTAVVLYHAGWERVNGSQGVLVFFTLSGFLITWLLTSEERVSLKNFYVRRALRLFPAFYAYWGAMVALRLLTHKEVPWGSAISAFFYVGNYYNATHGHPSTFITHAWSLAVEEQFYLFWPVVYVALRRDWTKLVRVLVVIISAVWFHRCVLVAFRAPEAWLYNAFDCRLDHLLVGCLGAVLLRNRALPATFDFLARSRAFAAATLAFLVTIGWFEAELGRTFLYAVAHAIEPPLVMALLVFVIANAKRPAARWLEVAPLRHVGKVSYGIYLFHPALHATVRARTSFAPVAVQMAAVVAVSVGVATVSYALFEKRFLALKSRFVSGGQASAVRG